MSFLSYFRSLTSSQKALILAYAEIDKEVSGTINGVVDTTSGKLVICIIERIVRHSCYFSIDHNFHCRVRGIVRWNILRFYFLTTQENMNFTF